MKKFSLGLEDALRITLEHISPLGTETIPLAETTGRVAAFDLYAIVDAPSTDSSLKDGYAVHSHEVTDATPDNPVRLKLIGHLAAGGDRDYKFAPGTTVRVLTGARIPAGADAVVSEEFVKPEGENVLVMNFAEAGRNIQPRGRDVESGSSIVRQGQQITPGIAGLIAAAGHSMVPVYRNPAVAIIGTGDEIVLPGEPLTEGKLYSSNTVTLDAWCRRYGMKTSMMVVHDDVATLTETLRKLSADADAIITSGGAWTGDRDLVAQVLEGLGWHQHFHRIRIGPGKAVGFGMLESKPVFILPGGPSSNIMGFLQIALPGLLALAGHPRPGLPVTYARLARDLEGQHGWTDFFSGTLEEAEGLPVFHPSAESSRLREIAEGGAIAALPEDVKFLPEGSVIPVQVLK